MTINYSVSDWEARAREELTAGQYKIYARARTRARRPFALGHAAIVAMRNGAETRVRAIYSKQIAPTQTSYSKAVRRGAPQDQLSKLWDERETALDAAFFPFHETLDIVRAAYEAGLATLDTALDQALEKAYHRAAREDL